MGNYCCARSVKANQSKIDEMDDHEYVPISRIRNRQLYSGKDYMNYILFNYSQPEALISCWINDLKRRNIIANKENIIDVFDSLGLSREELQEIYLKKSSASNLIDIAFTLLEKRKN
jgi:DNA-directed RNA polymerase subunit N (RpoN/RPB10)